MKELVVLLVVYSFILQATAYSAFDVQKCPPTNPPIDVLFPHETDCTKFYKCNFGEKVIQTCPAGLHFNPKVDYCDWPENVDCGNVNPEVPSNNKTCPPTNPPIDILFPHETDCSKFYKCDLGEKVEQQCPEDLNFNPEEGFCDWPTNVDCNYKESVNPLNCTLGDILLPHELERNKFYLCYDLEKMTMECPNNFIFNSKTNRCVQ